MANHPSLKIIESCTVTPPPETVEPISLPLTFFDLLWLRFYPVQRIFFYQMPSMETNFHESILPNLKISLSAALRRYLPLAGHLIWPDDSYKPVVEFVNGDGVLLTVAESDADFHRLSGDGFREAAEYHPLVPQLPESDERIAVMALQLTFFPNAGFSIGITNHHAILDGRTSTSFVKSWARLCHLELTGTSSATEPPPVYDRTVIDDRSGLDAIFADEWEENDEGPENRSLRVWPAKTPPGLIRCTFHLSRHSLNKLKKSIQTKREKKEAIHLSSFTAATAYSWVCAAKAEGVRDCKIRIVFAVDARSRLESPVPENYFGNCLAACDTVVERNELLSENGIVIAGEAISEAIRSLEGGVLKGTERWVSEMIAGKKGELAEKMISIAGSPRFEVYSVDFGWGKPRKVEIVSIDGSGAFGFSESRNGDGGMEIELVRERDEMKRFAAVFDEGLEAL